MTNTAISAKKNYLLLPFLRFIKNEIGSSHM